MSSRPLMRRLKQTASVALGASLPLLAQAAALPFISTDSMQKYTALPVTSVDSAQPQAMITLSKDHTLFLKAYNDYTDLDGDGVVETTYKHGFDYYGYFDSYKCYTYNTTTNRFVPATANDQVMTEASDSAANLAAKYCGGGQWSGNFLNWAAMARIDVVRKILLGGKRMVDESISTGGARTVLERSYLPNDAHSWAKYYAGSDIKALTPFDVADLTLCNTTLNPGFNRVSQNVVDPPLLRVAQGNYTLWAANERWQCLWSDEQSASNGNNAATSGIAAASSNPVRNTVALGSGVRKGDFAVQIEVCVAGFEAGDRCKTYPDGTPKPIGLMQEYGDSERMWFGFTVGTYAKNKSGGDVMKRIEPLTDEINVNVDGRFIRVAGLKRANGSVASDNPAQSSGVINALSLYRIVEYNHNDGLYNDCTFRLAGFNDGACANWGNPLAEAYLQTLRWYANLQPTGQFRGNDKTYISALNPPQSFQPPSVTEANGSCVSLNTIVFNSSTISYDGDQLDANAYGLDSNGMEWGYTSKQLADMVGTLEGIHGNSYFVGTTGDTAPGDDGHQICTAKKIGSLGDVTGICPEAPRLEGTFKIAGMAYYAYNNDINIDGKVSGDQALKTYAVQLASATPTLQVPVPGTRRQVTILPSCLNQDLNPDTTANRKLSGACAIVDFKIVEPHTESGGIGKGKVYVNWENGEQGGDFDQDMWGTLSYEISNNQIKVTTETFGYSGGGARMGFGYIISGTTQDGVHYHSGAGGSNGNGSSGGRNSGPFYFKSPYAGVDCSVRRSGSGDNGCRLNDPATTRTFTLGSSDAQLLKDPLWYAAKYGGFTGKHEFGSGTPLQQSQWDVLDARGNPGPDGNPDNYFFAVEPRQLEDALRRVFNEIIGRTSSGTAASVVANAREGVGAVFQALFEPLRQDNSGREVEWIGTLHALWIDELGRLREDGNANRQLDDLTADPVVELFFDETNPIEENRRTRVRRFRGDPASTTPELDEIERLKTLWNGRERLSALSNVTTQRSYSALANGGRHILTWLDLDRDGIVDNGEQRAFASGTFTAGNFGILNTQTLADAQKLVNYSRGQDVAGLRNRTVDYKNNGTPQVMRMGDIVQSTPTAVSQPAESFDLLYDDATYAAFRERYRNRRQVVYVGANDGMLHAFNGGFYNAAARRFDLTGNNSEIQHPLGTELWAYVPFNLLPHLTWFSDPDYTHVWYMDGKPRVFDARIYDDKACSDAVNPCGWATLLVVGFRFGGGDLTLPAKNNNTVNSGFADFNTANAFPRNGTLKTRSAFVVLDVTNPEAPPKLLTEISSDDIGFASSFPTVVANRTAGLKPGDAGNTDDSWYLVFGGGPDNLDSTITNLGEAQSSRNGKFFVYDLKKLVAATPSVTPAKVYDLGATAAKSFVTDPVTVDWDLDFKGDSVYFGTVSTTVQKKKNNADEETVTTLSSQSGKLFKLDLKESGAVADWVAPKVMLNPGAPVVATPSVTFDEEGNRWVMAGTGRFYADLDKPTTFANYLFGVIDSEPDTAGATAPIYSFANLVDVSGARVRTDNTLITPVSLGGGTQASDIDQLTEGVIKAGGWKLNLVTGTGPAERNVTQTSILGDVFFAAGFTPSDSLCSGEGRSQLYGLFYKTGTARGDLPIFGTVVDGVTGTEEAIRDIDLGVGLAAAPSLHVGAARDQRGITVLTQTSTGAIERREADVSAGARSGEVDWREPRP